MATSEPDPDGFQPVIAPKTGKKAKTTPTGAPRKKPEIETDVRMIFQLPQNHRGTFNPTHKMKQLITELMRYDPTLAIKSLTDDDDALFPQFDKFPTKETDFEQYFVVHPIPKRPIYRNQITVGCCILSTKTISDIKKATTDQNTMMEWLKKQNIFIEVDSLGRKTIRTIGYLFFLHPHMTHHVSLKGIIREALTDIKISKEEVEEIDPNANSFFKFSNDEMTGDTDIDIGEETDDDDKLINIPFEIFHTGVGYSITTKRVATKALAIKCNVENGKILHELLLRMQFDKNIFPSAQYIPVGMANLLGPEPYKQLIRQNNAYLQTMASIPILGFTDATLNYMIPVHNGTPGTTRTIREILMSTEWCTQIEPTQTPGRMLLLTTKSNLDTGRKWLDDNLTTIFQFYLPRNPDYVPDTENPTPHHGDIRPANTKLDSYADALRQSIIPPPQSAKNTNYAKPPPHRAPQDLTISYTKGAATTTTTPQTTNTKEPKKRKSRTNDATSTTSEHSMETLQTQTTISTIAQLKQEVMATLRQELTQIIQNDVQQLQNDFTHLQQSITSATDKTTTDIQTIQQQLAASNEQFQLQMREMNRNFQMQMQAQHAQMTAFFQQFNQPNNQQQPPPSSSGGGAH